MLAHRFAYELVVGPIPDGLHVCHSCDNRYCVNPSHLFVGTAKDNIHDMIAKGRKTILQGEQLPITKITWEQVLSIRADGRSCVDIALEYGISPQQVSKIKLMQQRKRA